MGTGTPLLSVPRSPEHHRGPSVKVATPPWSQSQRQLREGCSGKRRDGSRELWVPLCIWATACCVTSGKTLSLSGPQFSLLQKQTRVYWCYQNPPGQRFNFRFLAPTPRGPGWDRCRGECISNSRPHHPPKVFPKGFCTKFRERLDELISKPPCGTSSNVL